jgi:hypothetical protein
VHYVWTLATDEFSQFAVAGLVPDGTSGNAHTIVAIDFIIVPRVLNNLVRMRAELRRLFEKRRVFPANLLIKLMT